MLSGMVGLNLAAGTLTFTGNNLANGIEVRQDLDVAPDAFEVTGIDGTWLDSDNDGTADTPPGTPVTISGVTDFAVNLGQDNDTFRFLSRADGTGNPSEINGNVVITCDLGENTNIIGDDDGGVNIRGALTIQRTDADNISSKTITEIVNSEVGTTASAATNINPARLPPRVNNGGSSETRIRNSVFWGNLNFQAREGTDIFNFQDSTVYGNVTINTVDPANLDELGGSQITFTGTPGNVNRVVGTLNIQTASSAADFFTDEDFVSLNQTVTDENVVINTGNGPAQVLVQENTDIGTDLTKPSQDLDVTFGNAANQLLQQFELKNAAVEGEVDVDVDAGATARLKVTVEGGDIGWATGQDLNVNARAANTLNTEVILKTYEPTPESERVTRVGGDVIYNGGAGDDKLDIKSGTNIQGDATFTSRAGNDLFLLTLLGEENGTAGHVRDVTHTSTGGSDQLSISNTEEQTIRNLTANLGAGNQDKVYLEYVTVSNTTNINLGAGIADELKLLSTVFSGLWTLDGGAGDLDEFIADDVSHVYSVAPTTGFEVFTHWP